MKGRQVMESFERDEGQKPQQLPLNGMPCVSDDVALTSEGTAGNHPPD